MRFQESDEFDTLAKREAHFLCTNWLEEAHRKSSLEVTPICSKPVNGHCREKLVEWCYDVVDYFHFNEEVVEIAVSMVDRYLSTYAGKHVIQSRQKFRLVFLTSLFVACKAIEKNTISSKDFAKFGRGVITWKDLIQMESEILFALNWRVYRPTTRAILHSIFQRLPCRQERQYLFRFVKVYSRLATRSSDLIGIPASAVVYAAVANSSRQFAQLRNVSKLFSETFHLDLFCGDDVRRTERIVSNSPELNRYVAEMEHVAKQRMRFDSSFQYRAGRSSPRSVSDQIKPSL